LRELTPEAVDVRARTNVAVRVPRRDGNAARTDLQKFLELSPTHPEAEKARAIVGRSFACGFRTHGAS
jgi:hypothetical protein